MGVVLQRNAGGCSHSQPMPNTNDTADQTVLTALSLSSMSLLRHVWRGRVGGAAQRSGGGCNAPALGHSLPHTHRAAATPLLSLSNSPANSQPQRTAMQAASSTSSGKKKVRRGQPQESGSSSDQELRNILTKMLTPAPYVEYRSAEQLQHDQAFAKAYSRYRMQEHRQQQLLLRKKLIRRWEALNSLPEELKEQCMKPDRTAWPLWLGPQMNQPRRSVHKDDDGDDAAAGTAGR